MIIIEIEEEKKLWGDGYKRLYQRVLYGYTLMNSNLIYVILE